MPRTTHSTTVAAAVRMHGMTAAQATMRDRMMSHDIASCSCAIRRTPSITSGAGSSAALYWALALPHCCSKLLGRMTHRPLRVR